MRRIFIFLVLAFLLAGCDMSGPGVGPSINLDPDQGDVVMIPGVGGVCDVKFTSSCSWKTDLLYADDEGGWFSLSDTSGVGSYKINKLSVEAEKNRTGARRTVWLTISSGLASTTILFTQGPYVSGLDEDDGGAGGNGGEGNSGSEPIFRLSEGSAEIGPDGGVIQLKVQHNVKYECKVTADWITEMAASSYEEAVHVFDISPNTGAEQRSATISFCTDQSCIPFTVIQAASDETPVQ